MTLTTEHATAAVLQPECVTLPDLASLATLYADRPDLHRAIYAACEAAVEASPALLRHRAHVEEHWLGFGDRAFHWVWRLLVDAMPQRFSFLEIGVYKGQVLSLVGMLALQAGKDALVYGVTPLAPLADRFSAYDDADYPAVIDGLQAFSGIPLTRRARLLAGLSTAPEIKRLARGFAPYDIVYIDGSHDYAVVVEDIVTYRDMLADGGYLLLAGAATELALPPGLWPGRADVGRAVRDVIQPDARLQPVCSVGHLRVWRKRAAADPAAADRPALVAAVLQEAEPRRPLVLAACSGSSLADLTPLVASLRHAAPAAELCLFASDMAPGFAEQAAALGIRLEDAAPYLDRGLHPLLARFVMFRDFLAVHGARYDRVLLSDARDVVFQADPFAMALEAEVVFATEDPLIAWEAMNFDWIAAVYGTGAAQRLGDNPVACVGTTLGTLAGIRRYCDLMCREIETREFDRARNLDQGIHNYVVWSIRPEWGVADLSDAIVNTVGCTAPERISVRDGAILVDGAMPPVVHQWDCHTALADLIESSPHFRLDVPPEPVMAEEAELAPA